MGRDLSFLFCLFFSIYITCNGYIYTTTGQEAMHLHPSGKRGACLWKRDFNESHLGLFLKWLWPPVLRILHCSNGDYIILKDILYLLTKKKKELLNYIQKFSAWYLMTRLEILYTSILHSDLWNLTFPWIDMPKVGSTRKRASCLNEPVRI